MGAIVTIAQGRCQPNLHFGAAGGQLAQRIEAPPIGVAVSGKTAGRHRVLPAPGGVAGVAGRQDRPGRGARE